MQKLEKGGLRDNREEEEEKKENEKHETGETTSSTVKRERDFQMNNRE